MTFPTPIDWTQPSATILSQLLEIVERRRPISESWATGARGLRDFGPGSSGWGGMVAKLRQIGFSDVADQMVNGMDFGDPQVQVMLTQLGMIEPDTFTDERVAIMKDWGVESKPRWTLEGFTTQPTISDVDKRKGSIGVKTKWEGISAVIDDQIHRGLITEWQQVVDIVAGE
jgi:hypothetical protein